MTTEEGFARLKLEHGADSWWGSPKMAIIRGEGGYDTVEVDLREGGKCTVEAALEFFMGKDEQYSGLMEERLDSLEEYGSDEQLGRRITQASNYALKRIFKERLGAVNPDIERRFRCRVDDVHIHNEARSARTEHVHVACRETLRCPEAFEAADALIEASMRLKEEKNAW